MIEEIHNLLSLFQKSEVVGVFRPAEVGINAILAKVSQSSRLSVSSPILTTTHKVNLAGHIMVQHGDTRHKCNAFELVREVLVSLIGCRKPVTQADQMYLLRVNFIAETLQERNLTIEYGLYVFFEEYARQIIGWYAQHDAAGEPCPYTLIEPPGAEIAVAEHDQRIAF